MLTLVFDHADNIKQNQLFNESGISQYLSQQMFTCLLLIFTSEMFRFLEFLT